MYGELPEGPQFPSPVVGKHNPKLQFFEGGGCWDPPPKLVRR